MKKLIGIGAFLVILYLMMLTEVPREGLVENHRQLGERIGRYGLVGLGAGLLIIVGGIDLSIGSVAALSGTLAAMLMNKEIQYSWLPILNYPLVAILVVLLMGAAIGLLHGLLVAGLRLQAFVVTLCGLFIYRGLARWLANEAPQGLGNELPWWKDLMHRNDFVGLPKHFFILMLVAGMIGLFLHFSIYGRYLFAIGNNEKAAIFSGIKTKRYRILAFVLSSMLASLYGILYLTKQNSVAPSSAMSYLELYAIAAAVLGGCSLRGGEGSVPGIIIGTCILQLLLNLVNLWEIKSAFEPAVVGGALLLGAVIDEGLRLPIFTWGRSLWSFARGK